jgi:hypothetical protein
MRLVRFDDGGEARLGVVRGELIVPLDAIRSDYPTMLTIVAGGGGGLAPVYSSYLVSQVGGYASIAWTVVVSSAAMIGVMLSLGKRPHHQS